jgi:hypothetical protein
MSIQPCIHPSNCGVSMHTLCINVLNNIHQIICIYTSTIKQREDRFSGQ